MEQSHILIVGAGWLGMPLAKALMQQGYKVTATRTLESGVTALVEHGINGFSLDLAKQDTELAIKQTSLDIENLGITAIIGCFPPGFRKGAGDGYPKHWQTLTQIAKQAKVKKLVMISSSAVYPEQGEIMTEDMAKLPIAIENPAFNDKSVILLTAEEAVRNSTLDYAIIRCSGLFGPLRHPSRFAAKLSSVSDQAAANMLHLDDAIGITLFALENVSAQVINATTPKTCDKASFYRAALRSAGLDTSLNHVNSVPNKTISSERAERLGYVFKYQHTLDAL
ncbi:NAD-dependent epimerase/dehydratase family protein [Vibrio hippocampi]|uniref:Protein YeeZ n=1 Tax=Vibrio hippocampi TaxID=654686 RepID=A0ABN8DFZ2_9VIBR|nr:NAD-dependent epimerase/dehydratase family protein [Vibrio hippocampi]CAH0526393.1 Protein YeeZ [Vibrio hippocampi]